MPVEIVLHPEGEVMSDEMKAIRKELYFAIGNTCTQIMKCVFNSDDAGKKNAATAAYILVQFGMRANLITEVEGSELLKLIKDDGCGCATVFKKHGHIEEAASSLVAGV